MAGIRSSVENTRSVLHSTLAGGNLNDPQAMHELEEFFSLQLPSNCVFQQFFSGLAWPCEVSPCAHRLVFNQTLNSLRGALSLCGSFLASVW